MEISALAARAVALLTEKGLTVATAESCTGGMMAAALTDVAGASRVFGTGVVSYSAQCKREVLGVSAATIEAQGTVASATAAQMAQGVRRLASSSIGMAVTGEAGPVAAESHPVGTVFIALADAESTCVEQYRFDGDRCAVRRQAVEAMFSLLIGHLEEVERC